MIGFSVRIAHEAGLGAGGDLDRASVGSATEVALVKTQPRDVTGCRLWKNVYALVRLGARPYLVVFIRRNSVGRCAEGALWRRLVGPSWPRPRWYLSARH